MNRISILLVEDHQVVREGFRSLLLLDSRFEVIGEASNGREAVAMAREKQPNVIMMDIAMPILNGLEATRQILADNPLAIIVLVTAHRDVAYMSHALESGAAGFLFKHTSADNLYKCLYAVHQGETGVGEMTDLHHPALTRVKKSPNSLTPREAEVLQLIAEGKANKETAHLLTISSKTVEKHRANLMEKLNLHDTAAITRYAIANGIIESAVHSTLDTQSP